MTLALNSSIKRLNYAVHAGGVLSALAIGVLGWGVIRGLAEHREELLRSHAEAEAVTAGDARTREHLAALARELADARRRNAELRERLTETPVETGFVVQLTDAAARTGVEIGGVHPGQKNLRDGIGQLHLNLHCDGTFAAVATFLDEVRKLPRACYVSNLKLAADDGRGSLRGELGLDLLYGRAAEVRP
jgi:Tfp pilus assembly protein PilO